MIRKFTLLLLACLGAYSLSFAQPYPVCGFDQIHRARMQSDPAYAATVNQFNANLATWLAQQQNKPQSLVTTYNGNKAWEIPVAVHVVHTGQAVGNTYNPSDATIIAFINYLSQAFTASYSGHLLEANGGTRIPIVFKLALRDQNCANTNGIERINLGSNPTYVASGVQQSTPNPGIPDVNFKQLVPGWPNTEYYNIWMVYKINGFNQATATSSFTAGYAYFPTGGPSAVDGTVMLSDQVAVGNSVITHELGHAFDLYHVFEDDDPTNTGSPTTCPAPPGDFVADTEPMKRSLFNCPTEGTNLCNPPLNLYNNTQHNFMDYSNCKDRFTPGQRVRVWNALMNTAAYTVRSSLISSLGATALGSTTVIPAACTNPGGPINPSPNNLGPRAVSIIKSGGSNPDTFIMNAISGSYSGDGNKHYFDRTCQHRAELVAGQQYSFRVTVGPNNENVRAWIDYDNNGTFSNLEQIYTPSAGAGTRPASTFTVPFTATSCTPLRLRVITNNGGGVPGPCTTPINGQCEDYEVVIRGGSGSGNIVPNMVTVSIDPLVGNPSCAGAGMKVIATWPSGVTPVWFQWFKKTTTGVITTGPSGANADTFKSVGFGGPYADNSFTDKDTIWVRMAIPGTCGSDTTLDSVVIYRPPTVTPSLGITVSGGVLPTCIDDTVTLSVFNVVNNGGSYYQWYKNGVSLGIGGQGATYKVINATNGDVYSAHMIFSPGNQTTCNGFATDVASINTITITLTTKAPTVSIALTTGTNPGCAGQLLTFTAVGTTKGQNPTYQWKVNGINAGASTTNPQFSSVFNNNDVVSVVMTSSSACAVPTTATSNTITITQQQVIADITIVQVSGGNPACSGHPVIFSATPVNAGPNPQFQWLINNNPVTGANAPVFNTTSLVNGDVVKCILISSDPCVVNTFDTSNTIQMQVTPSKVPSVTFTITKGNNPGCLDSLVEFTATSTNAGVNPAYEWFVNGFALNLNNPVFSSYTLLNNDIVVCRVAPTDGGCYLPDTAFSAQMIMVRSTTPDPPIISLISNMLVTDINGSFVWFGPGGQLTGGTDGRYHPLELGQYWCVTNNNGCWSKPSNKLTITLLDINTIGLAPADIYPNPTTGKLNVSWGRNVNMNVDIYSAVGQKLMHVDVRNEERKELDLSAFANGIYMVVISDEQGRSSIARITVNK